MSFAQIGDDSALHMTMFVRKLSLILHLPFVALPFPGHVMYLLTKLIPIVGFDFLDNFFDWEEQKFLPMDFKR